MVENIIEYIFKKKYSVSQILTGLLISALPVSVLYTLKILDARITKLNKEVKEINLTNGKLKEELLKKTEELDRALTELQTTKAIVLDQQLKLNETKPSFQI